MRTTDTLGTVRPSKPADMVTSEADRLNGRLGETLAAARELRDRIVGQSPPNQENEGDMATAFAVGGFVGGVGSSLERSHRLITDIDAVLRHVAEVI